MDTPVTPDPDAAGTTQRRSFIPAEDDPAFLPFFLAALGQPITGQVHTWEYRPPIRDIAPPRVQICNQAGDVLHDLPVTNLQINWTNARAVYQDEAAGLTSRQWRAVIEDSWDSSAASGVEYGRELTAGIIRGMAQELDQAFTATPEQRAAAAQWQQERETSYRDAQQRAKTLLLSLLTPAQQRAYAQTHTIKVRGSDKRRYRITYGRTGNVQELDRAGNVVAEWCAAPGGGLPIEDVLAAQLLWLRTDAAGFRAVANKLRINTNPARRRSSAAYFPPERDDPCNCAFCREDRAQRRRRRAVVTDAVPPTLRLTADPLPDMEPRIIRRVYDYGRVSGHWIVGESAFTRFIVS